jgi:hypothetical protein
MFNKKILINLNCLRRRVVEIQNTFEGNTCKNRRELKYIITFEGKASEGIFLGRCFSLRDFETLTVPSKPYQIW